jgi:hypothetical protein
VNNATRNVTGGSAWGSNPPRTLEVPPDGFEVREAHRDLSAPPCGKVQFSTTWPADESHAERQALAAYCRPRVPGQGRLSAKHTGRAGGTNGEGIMMVDMNKLTSAIHWWSADRFTNSDGTRAKDEKMLNRLHRLGLLLTFLFQNLNAFYLLTRDVPEPWSSNGVPSMLDGGSCDLVLNIPVGPAQYIKLRSILALVNDVRLLTEATRQANIDPTNHIHMPLRTIARVSDKSRDARDLFAHLDQALSNPDAHGITGALKTACCIEYTATARGASHIVLAGNSLFFTWKKHAYVVDVGRKAFDGIFDAAREIYSENDRP